MSRYKITDNIPANRAQRRAAAKGKPIPIEADNTKRGRTGSGMPRLRKYPENEKGGE